MVDEPARKIKLIKPVPDDAADIEELWLDTTLGDGITDTHWHTIPVDKPKNYFRMHPDPAYRRRTEIYTHKPEGVIDVQHYIVGPKLRGRILEAQPCTLVVVVYRDGTPRLWPLKFPRPGDKDNDAWVSARSAARVGLTKWTKLVWVSRAYQTRDAQKGYAPEPDFSKLPPFNEMVKLAFGADGVMRDEFTSDLPRPFGSGSRRGSGHRRRRARSR